MADEKPRTPKASDQSKRFVEAARVLGADENEVAFRTKLGVIARWKPKGVPPAARPKEDAS